MFVVRNPQGSRMYFIVIILPHSYSKAGLGAWVYGSSFLAMSLVVGFWNVDVEV
jgi:hypothetical protein